MLHVTFFFYFSSLVNSDKDFHERTVLTRQKPTRQYLTWEQLLTLTTVYFKTPYPDKLMKEHLVTKTGQVVK